MGPLQNPFHHCAPQAKEKCKGQVNKTMNIKTTALIADELHKVATQFDEGQHQLANFSESKRALKELVHEFKNNITASEKMVKALNKMSNKENHINQQNHDNKNQNAGNRSLKPPIMHCHLCGRTNDTINFIMKCTNTKT